MFSTNSASRPDCSGPNDERRMLKWITSVSEKVLPSFLNRENNDITLPNTSLSSSSSRRSSGTSPSSSKKRGRPRKELDEKAAPTKTRRISQNAGEITSDGERNKDVKCPRTPTSTLNQSLRRVASYSKIATTSECSYPVAGTSSLLEAPHTAHLKSNRGRPRKSDSILVVSLSKTSSPIDFSHVDNVKKQSLKRDSNGQRRLSLETKPLSTRKSKKHSKDIISHQQRTITSFFVKVEPIEADSVSITSVRCSPRKSKNVPAETGDDDFVDIFKKCEKKVVASTRQVKTSDRNVPMHTKARIIANKYHKLRTIKQEIISPIRKSPRLLSSVKNTPIGILGLRQTEDMMEKPTARKSLQFGPVGTPKKTVARPKEELGSPELRSLPDMSPKMVTPTSSPSLKALSESPAKTPLKTTSRKWNTSPTKESPLPKSVKRVKIRHPNGDVAVFRMRRIRRAVVFRDQYSPSKLQRADLFTNSFRNNRNRSWNFDFSLLNQGTNSPKHATEEEGIFENFNEDSTVMSCMSPRATSRITPRSHTLQALLRTPSALNRILASPPPNSTPMITRRYNRETQNPNVAEFLYHLNEIRRMRVEQWVNGKEEREKIMDKIASMNLRGKQLKPHSKKWAAAWQEKKQMNFSLDEKKRKLVQQDISNGLERHPINAWTYTSTVKQPQFEYIKGNTMVAPLKEEHDPNWTICCSCEGECDINCECVKASVAGGCFVADKFLVTSKYSDFYNTFLVACGPKCKCRANCSNSVDNILDATKRFELFSRDDKMGYGVRTKEPIETNTILFEFQGEVINKAEHTLRIKKTNRLTSSYSYMIYEKQGKDTLEDYYLRILKSVCQNIRSSNLPDAIYIDPSKKGNIGRFFSHSEYPNTMCLRFIVNDARPEACRLLFYNTMPIRAGDEITFDYGHHFKMPNCLCGLLCCGDSGIHLLTQPKKTAYKMLNDVHSNLYSCIRKYAESELIRISHNREKFDIHYKKYVMLKARAKKPLIPRPKKSSAPFGRRRNKKRWRNRQKEIPDNELVPEQERERSPGTPSSTGSRCSDQSKENVKRISPHLRKSLTSLTSNSSKIALRPRT